MCGDTPCEGRGYAGTLTLGCRGRKIEGSKLLMYASLPPPGKAITAPLEAVQDRDRLTLRFTDSSGCRVEYSASLKDGRLTGVYSRQGCAGPDWGKGRGNLLVTKSPTTHNNGMHPTPR